MDQGNATPLEENMKRRKPTVAPLLPITDYTFLYVECPPGLGKNNTRYADKGSKRLSADYLTFRDYVWMAWSKARQPQFKNGRVGMEIVAFWDRLRTFDDGHETPFADVDAIDKGTLDSLQLSEQCSCDCLDTDMRVEPLILRKSYDKQNPHVEILIWRC